MESELNVWYQRYLERLSRCRIEGFLVAHPFIKRYLAKCELHFSFGQAYPDVALLQECATDSEELIYPLRAPSTCSAPPDLLMTSDREPIGIRTPQSTPKNVKITTKTKLLDETPTEKLCLEEFTCDVSVEGGKSSQPLQFSFTFYDLDGHHHGKITKEDIAGLVYTIYESIGKSVVVPHCGSKTINVRLTVSPDAKSKNKKPTAITSRRQRCKPRRIIQSDEEDGSENFPLDKNKGKNEPKITSPSTATHATIPMSLEGKCNLYISESPTGSTRSSKEISPCSAEESVRKGNECPNNIPKMSTTRESIYETLNDFKCCAKPSLRIDENIIEVNGCRECSMQCPLIDVSVPCKPMGTRKVLRKSRARKQRGLQTYHARVRSLSVGNESSFRNKTNNGNLVEGAEECLNNLRRNDLIDIIRESMEKNRLCFQSTGKTTESPTRHRHRSHTISKFADDHRIIDSKSPSNNHSKANLCGYDSFLHATMCSNNATTTIQPIPINSPKILQSHNNRVQRLKQKSNEIHLNASPQLQGYTKLNSIHAKLNMSMLNQLNPQLTPEQKFSRTINHVENWLNERDVFTKTGDFKLKISEDKNTVKDIAKDDKNIDNLINTRVFVDKLKIAEKCTEKLTETSKTTFKKESLLSRKASKDTRNINKNQKGPVMEYASIPITVDPSECENLLRASSDESSQATTTTNRQPGTPTNNNTHIHIHHHFHHFENGADI
ncbi:Protein naked cuticle like [Pseudolycoriella hygida]|uniref:Protein naked cuticle homolog n=1 Tax=Pseudolycoriella hygida TaxID=35572 RepID=A0A9Q0NCN1_9DIPT|nr:Protein naked cuticle like [Pseudolycoriella hygida]